MKFSTERLILRPIDDNDGVEILGIRSNAGINQFLQRVPPQNSFEALEFILNIKRKSLNNEILFLGICQKNTPNLIGTICLWNFSEDRKTAELGYELLPDYQGKGLMSEAVSFILDYGFQNLRLNQIEAFTNKNNFDSIKLLERSGFILNENRKDKNYPENLIFEITSI